MSQAEIKKERKPMCKGSDPNAKKLKAAKRYGRALALIKQGLQLNQWGISSIDDNVFVIGKPEMCIFVKQLVTEALAQPEQPKAADSLTLGQEKK
jgi:hypothetical protein